MPSLLHQEVTQVSVRNSTQSSKRSSKSAMDDLMEINVTVSIK